MIVIITEGSEVTKFPRRGQVLNHVRLCVELVVELRCANTENAQIRGKHRLVLNLCLNFSLEPESGGVRSPEEFIGRQTIIDGEPVWELALGAPSGRKRGNTGAYGHEPIEDITQIPGADYLCGIPLRGV